MKLISPPVFHYTTLPDGTKERHVFPGAWQRYDVRNVTEDQTLYRKDFEIWQYAYFETLNAELVKLGVPSGMLRTARNELRPVCSLGYLFYHWFINANPRQLAYKSCDQYQILNDRYYIG